MVRIEANPARVNCGVNFRARAARLQTEYPGEFPFRVKKENARCSNPQQEIPRARGFTISGRSENSKVETLMVKLERLQPHFSVSSFPPQVQRFQTLPVVGDSQR